MEEAPQIFMFKNKCVGDMTREEAVDALKICIKGWLDTTEQLGKSHQFYRKLREAA